MTGPIQHEGENLLKSLCTGLIALTLAAVSLSAETTSIPASGTVVEYTPGKSLVIRDGSHHLVAYTLDENLILPPELQVGVTVTYDIDPDVTGGEIRLLTATSMTADGRPQTASLNGMTVSSGSALARGMVVEYVPRQSLTIRDADGKLTVYRFSAGILAAIDIDVAVGTMVTLWSEPTAIGNMIRGISTAAPGDPGTVATTIERTETLPHGSTVASQTTVPPPGEMLPATNESAGVVSAYEATRTITIQHLDGNPVTYQIDGLSEVPTDLAVGRRVTVQSLRLGQQPLLVVRTIAYVGDASK